MLARADAESRRALELDEKSAEAHAVRSVLLWFRGRLDDGLREAERAIELDPGSAMVHQVYAWNLMESGQVEDALAGLERARELDPLVPDRLETLGFFQLAAGDPDAAIASLRRALELAPDLEGARLTLARAYSAKGLDREALEEILRLPLPSEAKAAIRGGFERAGIAGATRASLELERMKAGRECTDAPAGAAFLLAGLGQADEMFACLREVLDRDRDPRFRFDLKVDPIYAPYRSDPRFAEVLRAASLEQ